MSQRKHNGNAVENVSSKYMLTLCYRHDRDTGEFQKSDHELVTKG